MLAKTVYMLLADTDREYRIKRSADRVFIDAVNQTVTIEYMVYSMREPERTVYQSVLDVRVESPSLTVL